MGRVHGETIKTIGSKNIQQVLSFARRQFLGQKANIAILRKNGTIEVSEVNEFIARIKEEREEREEKRQNLNETLENLQNANNDINNNVVNTLQLQ